MNSHYFIAISVEKLNSELKSVQQSLDHSLFKHIVHPKDFHITLMFLGEATEEQLGDLHVRLKEITRNITPFEIIPTRIGVFGKLSQPRVLYVDVDKTKSLEDLHELVVESCAAAGFKKDTREYRPHVTLAKKWKDPEKKIGRNMPEIKENSEEIQSIGLFRVSPSDTPRYKCVERYDFKK